MDRNLKALIIGSTGGIGRELVKELLKSNQWSEVHVIVRRELEAWSKLSYEQKNKLVIHKVDGLEILRDQTKLPKFQGLNAIFCTLGAEQKDGKENFIKVDKEFPLLSADLAIQNNIPQYHIVTSQMSDKSSMFLYLKIKGEVEYELSQKGFQYLGIYRPGLLLQREQPRLIERLCSYIPFIKKVDVQNIAVTMRKQAEKNIQFTQNKTEYFENNEIINISQNKN
ncbi:oxidoreductase htatip protein, putative (macronuclear) [Tetrahymena thermophila SB210]|uniref:Oxidoreductase htatip protein, putative n=1 Tax=Tetrahymena thermophila (strain SB210) TaxID=312017 RepID=Q22EG9_TETTS|nr:oxidoreductase htatip protein, putative [Tetrahymena thermophila SB210]EAR83683.1 oxidoreductase htatip protein, putative [Tetrahymena thermophila SB210]|eukprot:XP_001031346.1 oxidoreductase htatip protein, putative [Tetrahymena thermophila SB210]